MSDLQRIFKVVPAFNKRHPDPSKNYRIGAVKLCFAVRGLKGAVDVTFGTDWYLPEDQIRLRENSNLLLMFKRVLPEGWGVGCHSLVSMPRGMEWTECELVDGGKCYYDSSSCRADEWVKPFLVGGTDWLWPHLEAEYHHRFEGGPAISP